MFFRLSGVSNVVAEGMQKGVKQNMSYIYKLIGCEIMFREICLCASRSINIVDLEFMPKELHDIGEKDMSAKLQERINAVDVNKYNAILLCYGLCNNGIKGLHSKIPLVVSRAHDCITLLMGSKEKYSDYFFNNPGTFFKSSGWIERDRNPNENENSVTSKLGMDIDFDDYDEEEAEYLKSFLGSWDKNYSKYTYIDTGTGDSSFYEDEISKLAIERGWSFEKMNGNVCLIQDLMDGKWDLNKFLVVPPCNKITVTHGNDIVSYEPLQ